MTRGARALGALVAALAFAGAAAGTALAVPAYTVKTLHWSVKTGPNDENTCDVIGDLYRPRGVDARHPAPAILTTNGFGGSKDDQAGAAKAFATRGYVVLSYSGLGFGGSGCKIELDDPDYDGKAASQLVSFLGGTKGATDGTKVDYVRHDRPGDPRVGMIGGSYGGEIQFATASIDRRVDTIVPMITWNDLAYSLAPNNADVDHGVSSHTPGVEKYEWTSLFFALGIADGIQGAQADPSRNVGCPNFDDRACASKLQMDATGAPNDATISFARHASVVSYMSKIRIPTMLMQGQTDTLFNLNESVATYQALRAQRVPVKLVWHSWGHSGGTVPGEIDLAHPDTNYEGRTVLQWFAHYLKGARAAPSLDFTYFRDWVRYRGDATPAYARAPAYPAGRPLTLYLSGDGTLSRSASGVQAGSESFATPTAGAPASYTETSALDQSQPVTDAPGTTATFTSAPLGATTDVIGIPTVDLRISAPVQQITGQAGGPGEVVLFFRLEDIAPDGSVTLVHRLIAPARVAIPDDTVHVQLPGIVHRWAKGHRFALVVAASDAAYRGNNAPGQVSVVTDRARPGTLRIPTVAASRQGAVVFGR